MPAYRRDRPPACWYPPRRPPAERKDPHDPLPAHPVTGAGHATLKWDQVDIATGAIDATRPHPARAYDYYPGGKNHWHVGREAANKILAIAPEVRAIARASRGFLRRAVTHLARDRGVTQFPGIGTGIPASPGVCQSAAACAKGTRVACAGNDQVIHARVSALPTGTGTTRIILADLRDPGVIVVGARDFPDFDRPTALLLVAVLHFIPMPKTRSASSRRSAAPSRRAASWSCPTPSATSAPPRSPAPRRPPTTPPPPRWCFPRATIEAFRPALRPGRQAWSRLPAGAGRRPRAEGPEEDRQLRRGRRQELTTRPGSCP